MVTYSKNKTYIVTPSLPSTLPLFLLLYLPLSLLITLIFQTLLPSTLQAKDIVWQGEMDIPAGYRIAAEDNLLVKRGTHIVLHGEIEIEGKFIADQATFTGSSIILKNPADGSRISDCTFTTAKTALKILGGSLVIENSLFKKNDIGLELRQRSTATVKNSTFTDNRKVGFFVKDDATPTIIGNSFLNNGKYGLYLFRSNPLKLSGNIFTNNATGLMASGSSINGIIENNRFTTNNIGIFVDRAAAPTITGNSLINNDLGIKLYRRSDPTISGNLFAKNKKGLFISFSSYPIIQANDLEQNEIAIYLEYQSVVWERSQGESTRSSEIDRMSAFGRSDKREAMPGVSRTLPSTGLIDAQNNWWGERGTMELKQGSKNLSGIDDGHDRPMFLEEGKSYPLDTVDFSNFRSNRINQHLQEREK